MVALEVIDRGGLCHGKGFVGTWHNIGGWEHGGRVVGCIGKFNRNSHVIWNASGIVGGIVIVARIGENMTISWAG